MTPDHYPGYSHHYEWQSRPKYNSGPIYPHNSPYDPENRRHDYTTERHPSEQQQQPNAMPLLNRESVAK